MTINAAAIAEAKKIGKRLGAQRVAILAMDGPDYSVTIWGKSHGVTEAASTTVGTLNDPAICDGGKTAGTLPDEDGAVRKALELWKELS